MLDHTFGRSSDVSEVIIPSGYNPLTRQHDIALLKLSTPTDIEPGKLTGAADPIPTAGDQVSIQG